MFEKGSKPVLVAAVVLAVIFLVLTAISGQLLWLWGFLVPALMVVFSIDVRKIAERWIHQATMVDQLQTSEHALKETCVASFAGGRVKRFAVTSSGKITKTIYEANRGKRRIEVLRNSVGNVSRIKIRGPKTAGVTIFSLIWEDEVYRDSDEVFIGRFRGENADLLLIRQVVTSLTDADFLGVDFTDSRVSDLLVALIRDALQ